MIDTLAPFRSRREELSEKPELIDEVLANGAVKAAEEAGKTMTDVRAALKV